VMISILLHTHAFRCSSPGQASVYLASQTTVTGPVNTGLISYPGCTFPLQSPQHHITHIHAHRTYLHA
jgi:hypothetical protein